MICSQKGGKCRIKNPWPGSEVTLYSEGGKVKNISGSLLVLTTKIGETVAIVPRGKSLAVKEILQNYYCLLRSELSICYLVIYIKCVLPAGFDY